MQRYQQMFQRLNSEGRGAFVPFVTLGDPNPELSFEILKALVDGGADALELGIPFSDPIADGPTIQNANIRALAAGVTPAYLELRDLAMREAPEEGDARLLGAVDLDGVRLMDNVGLPLGVGFKHVEA